jgi:acyl dehydratase
MTWKPGALLQPLVVDPVRADLMVPMAAILDDPNPIHLDARVVRDLGYGDRVINQGPSNCGYVMNMIRAAVPDGQLASFKARFLGNVFGGDRVVAHGTVTQVTDDGAATLLALDVWLENGAGAKVLDGTASVVIERDPTEVVGSGGAAGEPAAATNFRLSVS